VVSVHKGENPSFHPSPSFRLPSSFCESVRAPNHVSCRSQLMRCFRPASGHHFCSFSLSIKLSVKSIYVSAPHFQRFQRYHPTCQAHLPLVHIRTQVY